MNKLLITIFIYSLFTSYSSAENIITKETSTVGGIFEIKAAKTNTPGSKIKSFKIMLNGKVVHEGDYEYFEIEHSYKNKLSSYVVVYGYEPIGASRCQTIILLFDIGKYGFDKHRIDHHGGIRCWEGPVSSSFEKNILKINAGKEMFIYDDDRYGNKAIEKISK